MRNCPFSNYPITSILNGVEVPSSLIHRRSYCPFNLITLSMKVYTDTIASGF
jgi:hypothetical protein